MSDTPDAPTKKAASIEAVLASLEGGGSIHAACKAAQIDRKTLYRWRKDDPELEAAVQSARITAIEVVEDALFLTAQKGNVTAQIFFLCNRASKRWRHVNRTEITGADGQPVAFSFADLVERIDKENGQAQAVKAERKADAGRL